jgi:hypothetical protein
MGPHEPLKGLLPIDVPAVEHGLFVPIAKVTPLDDPFVNVPKVPISQRNPRCTADIAGVDPFAEIAEALLERCEGKLKQIGYVPC